MTLGRQTELDSRARRPKRVHSFARHMGVILQSETVSCFSCHHPAGQATFGLDRRDGPLLYLCATNPASCGCNCQGRFGTAPEMLTRVPDPVGFIRVYAKPPGYPRARTT